jgi:serine phosphatase RsbU (regulator of sigma subunit)
MELQYAGAYNPLCLVRAGTLIEYKADKMPVGIYVAGKEKDFTNHLIPMQKDDMLYLFSDGYYDQFGGEDNAKFKSKPFKQLLTELSVLPVERQNELLIETHNRWKGDRIQLDDILVIGIRIN